MTDALIERLEKATDGSRELDAYIFCATAPSPFFVYDGCIIAQQGGFAARVEFDDVPKFTTSIDAALTLVPKGHWFEVGRTCADDAPMRFYSDNPNGHCFTGKCEKSYGEQERASRGATPALALCIAALKARNLS